MQQARMCRWHGEGVDVQLHGENGKGLQEKWELHFQGSDDEYGGVNNNVWQYIISIRTVVWKNVWHNIKSPVWFYDGMASEKTYAPYVFWDASKNRTMQHRFGKIIRLVRTFSYGVRFLRRKRTF